MAQIVIEFDDSIGSRVNNLLGNRWKYQANIQDPGDPENTIPNPESKLAFNKRMVVEYVQDEAIQQEIYEAGQDAAIAQKPISEAEIQLSVGS